MTEKEEKRCGLKAAVIVTWASQQVPCCLEHGNALARIGEVMGAPVQAMLNNDDSITCDQIVGEEAQQ